MAKLLVPEYCLSLKLVSQRSSATAGNIKFARDINLFGERNTIKDTKSFSKSVTLYYLILLDL